MPVIGCECEVCRSLDYRDKRLRSSVHISIDSRSLIIDTGPDFRQQMLREGIKRLDAVLLTHSHRDHLAGLDDVRAYNFLQSRDMPIYGNRESLDRIRLEFNYAFTESPYPGIPQLRLCEIVSVPFEVEGITVTPLPVLHHRMPVSGFRIANFSYITDANFIPEATFELLKGTEVLVLNALQQEKHISHFNLNEANDVAKKAGARKTYYTHISHKLGLHKDVERLLPEGVALATDGLTVEL